MSRSARARMTMRCVLQRNTAAAADRYNAPASPPSFTTLVAALACWYWIKGRREVVDGAKTAVIEDARMLVPSGTDVTARDRISTITDRRGTSVATGVWEIDGGPERRADHIELLLRAVR